MTTHYDPNIPGSIPIMMGSAPVTRGPFPYIPVVNSARKHHGVVLSWEPPPRSVPCYGACYRSYIDDTTLAYASINPKEKSVRDYRNQ